MTKSILDRISKGRFCPAHWLKSIMACSLLTPAVVSAMASRGPAPQIDDGLPPDSEYVVVGEDGHLSVNGERQRFWAAIGKPFIQARISPDDSPAERARKLEMSRRGTDAILDDLERRGFNAVRMWNTVRGGSDYVKGDGSFADCVDYFLAEAKRRGFRIWAAGVGNSTGWPSTDDVGIVDDPATAEAWQAAIEETLTGDRRLDIRHNIARAWDPRLEQLVIREMRRNAHHFNQHTGLRWADDPVFAVWELTNEEWWMRKMVGGQWQRLPAFFRNQLVGQWNDFLQEKYGTDQALLAAWEEMLPGESLARGSIIFAPMAGRTSVEMAINDANPAAREVVAGLETAYAQQDFSRQRGADVLEFLMDMQLTHKQNLEAAFKDFGKSTRLSPLVYDTGIGYEIQSQYLHQNANAVSHNAYVNGWGPQFQEPEPGDTRFPHADMVRLLEAERISANVGQWNNWLLKPPGICQGVPWLEHNRVEGKPFLVYETQIQQPAKYRADYPLRLLALASIQDWDWVSWHYYAPPDEVGIEENPFERPMDVTVGSHPQGYHYTYDEVQNAMMRAAGHAFRNLSLQPAANPTRFIYGRKSLYDPASMHYAGSYGMLGLDMMQTVYQYGVRIEIDPDREDDQVIGPVVSFDERNTHNPYTPTEEIRFDWEKGYLKLDAPTAMVFTGYLANYGEAVEFAHGINLRQVEIDNPEGIFDPVGEDEQYIAFAVYAQDGLPLAETRQASLSLVSTSFNSGFKMGDEMTSPYHVPQGTHRGGLPVLVARVGAIVEAPALDGMAYVARDWNGNRIAAGLVENGRIEISNELPIFVIELSR